MSSLLAEVVAQLNLKPGEAYRAEVDGYTVEVRRLEDDAPTPELAEQVMLQPWFEIPDPPAIVIVKSHPGPIDWPDRPEIPPEEEVG